MIRSILLDKSKGANLNEDLQLENMDGLNEEETKIWRMIPPEREHLTRLMDYAKSRKCLETLSVEDRRYLDALFGAKWDRIKSPIILKRLAL